MTEGDLVDAVRTLVDRDRTFEVAGERSLLRGLPIPAHAEELRVRGLRGIVRHDPAELTVTVKPGTTVRELNEELAGARQECPIEGPGTTVGGRIASGLSGIRRRGVGHVREWILGGRVVSPEGAAFRIGSATMKNVTGYDLPRLFCGAWGTLGIFSEVTLRVRPIPAASSWWVTDLGSSKDFAGAASVIRRPDRVHALLEGHPADCEALAGRLGLKRGDPPVLPSAVRISVPPDRLASVFAILREDFAAELGVGVVHLGGEIPSELPALRRQAEGLGGRLLILDRSVREASGLTTFGSDEQAIQSLRIKDALDPSGRLAPWRFLS